MLTINCYTESVTFGAYLREKRKAARITQRALADRVGVNFTYISKLENDALPPPSAKTLQAMAEVLMIDVEDLGVAAGKPPETVLRLELSRIDGVLTAAGVPVNADAGDPLPSHIRVQWLIDQYQMLRAEFGRPLGGA